MWSPVRIIIKGLMSHLDTSYEFKHGKCVMIYGENLSDDGADSNGSGKSVILEAITLAFTNEVSRDVADRAEFINDDCDETYICLELMNNSGDIRHLKIERTIHRTKSAKVKIYENNEQNKEITSVNEANSRIYELIGLTKYDLLNFFLLGQDKKFSFLTAGDSEKKDIIARFSNTDHILKKSEDLKLINKGIESQMGEISDKIIRTEERIELLTEQMSEKSGDFEEQKQKRIDSYNKKIGSTEIEISDKEKSVAKLQTNAKTYEDLIEGSDDYETEISDCKDKIKKINTKISKKEAELNQVEVYENHLHHLKEGEINCPNCNFSFILDEEISLDEIPTLLESLNENKVFIGEEIEALTNKRKKLITKRKKAEAKQEELDEWESELKKVQNKIKVTSSSIADLKGELKELKVKLKEVESSKPIKLNNQDKKEKIKEYKGDISTLQAEYDELKDKYEENGFWVHHFSKKGFLTFLTNKSIKSIEGITNSYLNKINTNLQLQIDGFTNLKGGGVNDRISVSILRNGKLVGSYGRYSGGEKGRINISNIVGLQKLINMSCPNGGLNFLGLDEVFEGLDVTGQKEVVKILEDLGITTLVVSHRSKPIGVENELIIKKINGISKILMKN